MERLSASRSAYFDAWRGGAAIVVFLAHLAQIYTPTTVGLHPLAGALAGGAVMAFFALSGFFIAGSLKARDWRWFTIARVDRLVPPLALALGLCVILWCVAPLAFQTGTRAFATPSARPEFSLAGLVATSAFLNGFLGDTLSSNGPLWSLSYEVWYYVLAALIVFGKRRTAIAVATVLVCLQPLFAIKGSIWVAGFLLGWRRSSVPRHGAWVWAAPASLLLLLLSPYAVPGTSLAFELSFGACFVLHLSRVADGTAPVVPVLPLTARFSYTLYVTHFPILLFSYGAGTPAWIGGLVAVTFAIVAGLPVEASRPWRTILNRAAPRGGYDGVAAFATNSSRRY